METVTLTLKRYRELLKKIELLSCDKPSKEELIKDIKELIERAEKSLIRIENLNGVIYAKEEVISELEKQIEICDKLKSSFWYKLFGWMV